MLAKILLIMGGGIILLLGIAHLYLTFFSSAFTPKDTQLLKMMNQSTIPLAKGTNLWKAWIGFNGSHSAGAIFFGLINIYLAINYFDIYQSAYLLQFFNIIMLLFLLFLAKNYWFKTPLIGISITLICFFPRKVVR